MSITALDESKPANADEQSLFDLLPETGEAKGNVTLQRQLGWDDDHYYQVRNALVDRGLLTRGRGRGGTVRRSVLPTPIAALDAPVEAILIPTDHAREVSLYEPMRDVIANDWAKDRRSDFLAVEVTAMQGRRATGGTWSRPDIVTVEVKAFTYVPGKFLELTTFEVKPFGTINVQAVYEALAHRRSATRSYVLLHVPADCQDLTADAVADVTEVARAHGIGVVVAADPSDYQSWEEQVEAERFEPDPARLDFFIAQQLSNSTKERIAVRLR